MRAGVSLTSVSVSSDRSIIGTQAIKAEANVLSIRTPSCFSFPAEGTPSSKSGIPACRGGLLGNGGGSRSRWLARFNFYVRMVAVALLLSMSVHFGAVHGRRAMGLAQTRVGRGGHTAGSDGARRGGSGGGRLVRRLLGHLLSQSIILILIYNLVVLY